jgi:hypothetical protein
MSCSPFVVGRNCWDPSTWRRWHSNADTDGNGYCDCDSNADRDCDSNVDTDGNGHCDSNADRDCNSEA